MPAAWFIHHSSFHAPMSSTFDSLDIISFCILQVCIINAPASMIAVRKFASIFTPAATRQEAEVHGEKYHAALEQLIGRENLPSCYGGCIPFEWQEHQPCSDLKPIQRVIQLTADCQRSSLLWLLKDYPGSQVTSIQSIHITYLCSLL
jgi:hypothetical protein